MLSNGTLEIRKCDKGEDEFLGTLAASITPREEVDKVLIGIFFRNHQDRRSPCNPSGPKRQTVLLISFNGSARLKKKCGAFSAIIWKLPELKILAAGSACTSDLNIDEAEYRGLLLGFDLLTDQTRGRAIICDDSNLVIRQMRGDIDCKASGLQSL